jgi:TolB-like protein
MMIIRKWIVVFFLALFTAGAGFSAAGNTNKTIAVPDFKNLSGNKGYDFLEKTLAESLLTSLQKSGSLNLVERQRLMNLIDEKKLVLTGLFDQDLNAGKKIGSLLKADHLILGSFSSIDDRIEVNARLVNIETGEILMAEKISEKMGDRLFARIGELGDAFVIRLMAFHSGYLNLDTSPQGAEVHWNSEMVGVTPLTEKLMKSGRYALTLKKEGYEISTVTVDVRENEKNNYNFNLERKIEFYPFKVTVTVHPFQLMQADYQPDWGVAFEYLLGFVSFGVEAGGNLYFHSYSDTNAPNKTISDTMSLYFHKFNALIKAHLLPNNRFISPYIGAGLGVFTASSDEYSFYRTDLYYKGIFGLTFFPSSKLSVFAEIIYQNLGNLTMNEKQFNLFGNYTLTPKPLSLQNFLVGLGIRFNF